MAASRSSSGVPMPCPMSRSSSPTVAASSGPIVVLSIPSCLPPEPSLLHHPNICSTNGPAASSRPSAAQQEGGGGQQGHPERRRGADRGPQGRREQGTPAGRARTGGGPE